MILLEVKMGKPNFRMGKKVLGREMQKLEVGTVKCRNTGGWDGDIGRWEGVTVVGYERTVVLSKLVEV